MSLNQNKPQLRLDFCSHAAAKHACKHWHYSKCMPTGKNNMIGVWENNLFIGAIIYGNSIGPYIGKRFGLDNMTCYELRRVALKKHKNTVSRIVSISIKMIKQKYQDAQLLISYADPMYNHVGGIYQAMNWIYIGTSTPMTQYLINGKYRNDKAAYSSYNHLSQGTRKTEPKHKYLYPLTKEMREQIEPLSRPYPKKCAGSIDSDALGTPSENEGGATPTPALQVS